MTKQELRILITTYFSSSEWETLMFDFCDANPRFNYFNEVNQNAPYSNKVSNTLLMLDSLMLSKLESMIMVERPHLAPKQRIYDLTNLRDVITYKYKEQDLATCLFDVEYLGYQFQWEKDIPAHLNYTNKVAEMIKYFQRRNALEWLIKRLGL